MEEQKDYSHTDGQESDAMTTPHRDCNDCALDCSTACCIIINSSGRDGSHGTHGRVGRDGLHGRKGQNGRNGYRPGERGEDGSNGSDGQEGLNGESGTDGAHGGDAEDIVIRVELGDSPQIIVVQREGAEKLELQPDCRNGREIVCVARGGKGGDGGNGGKGGNGGNGGHGGSGGSGYRGRSVVRQGEQPSVGGKGGNGGNGGRGGDSGRGGNGGCAGRGGNGGNVVIESTNAALFTLIKCDVRGGSAGASGAPGIPGIPGIGGNGGSGGSGASDGVRLSDAVGKVERNTNGNVGHHGKDGDVAVPGMQGSESQCGENGTVTFCVLDPQTGQVVQRSHTTPTLKVVAFDIRSADHDDGIFQPGENITISNIVIENDGEIDVPKGAILSFPSNSMLIGSVDDCYLLPCIAVGERFVCSHEFHGTIAHTNATNNNSYQCTIYPKITLMDRCILGSTNEQRITIEYPVRVEHWTCPEQLGQGEHCQIQIVLRNISQTAYGGKYSDSALCIHVSVEDDEIALLGPVDGIHLIDDLQPGEERHIEIQMAASSTASIFSQVSWKCLLLLGSEEIQTVNGSLTIIPSFVETMETNVLLVTDQLTTKREFLLYERIMRGLGIRANYWDIEKQHGFSFDTRTGKRHVATWAGDTFHQRVIIFAATPRPEVLDLFAPSDILAHLVDSRTGETRDSGLVYLTCGDHSNSSRDIGSHIIESLFTSSEEMWIPKRLLSQLYFVNRPVEQDLNLLAEKCIHNIRIEMPSRITRPSRLLFKPSKSNLMPYWSLGEVSCKQLPLSRFERLHVLASSWPAVPSVPFLSADRHFDALSATTFPISSNFCGVLIAIIRASSIRTKIGLLIQPSVLQQNAALFREERWKFRDAASGAEFTVEDIVQHSLCLDLLEESQFSDVSRLTRFESMVNEVHQCLDRLSNRAIHAVWFCAQRLRQEAFPQISTAVSSLFNKNARLRSSHFHKHYTQLSNMLFNNVEMDRNVANLAAIRLRADQEALSASQPSHSADTEFTIPAAPITQTFRPLLHVYHNTPAT